MNLRLKIVLIIFSWVQFSSGALPLTIINSMYGRHTFYVTIANERKKIILGERQKWTYNLKPNESIASIEWEYYDENQTKNIPYIIQVKKQMPPMAHGGTIAIAKNGGFIYDEKKGKLKIGQAFIKTELTPTQP